MQHKYGKNTMLSQRIIFSLQNATLYNKGLNCWWASLTMFTIKYASRGSNPNLDKPKRRFVEYNPERQLVFCIYYNKHEVTLEKINTSTYGIFIHIECSLYFWSRVDYRMFNNQSYIMECANQFRIISSKRYIELTNVILN